MTKDACRNRERCRGGFSFSFGGVSSLTLHQVVGRTEWYSVHGGPQCQEEPWRKTPHMVSSDNRRRISVPIGISRTDDQSVLHFSATMEYIRNHFEPLRRYLDDPLVPIDNNETEQ